jgi:hypothetical protein
VSQVRVLLPALTKALLLRDFLLSRAGSQGTQARGVVTEVVTRGVRSKEEQSATCTLALGLMTPHAWQPPLPRMDRRTWVNQFQLERHRCLLHRAGVSLAKRIRRIAQLPNPRRVAGPGALPHPAGGSGAGRGLAP